MTRVLMSCGEASGDLYAAALARELRVQAPSIAIDAFGGPRLAAAGARMIADYRGVSVTGLVEVIKLLPRTWRVYKQILAATAAEPPDVFVAIDFPDFNFRLGQALKRRGVRVAYYISPQLWAWRPGRIRTMQRFVDRALVIFPFEPAVYERAGIPVEFVGHPLLDLLEETRPRGSFLRDLALDPEKPTIALLPGSRHNEVHLILPVLLEAARLIASRVTGAQFVIARAPGLDAGLFSGVEESQRHGVRMAMVTADADNVLANCDVVATASGTATVQAALHRRPMVIVYRLSPLTYRLGIRFVRVNTYGMVNLVAGRQVVPELIQDACTPEAVARETMRFFEEPAYAANVATALDEVRARLGHSGASARAAAAVLRVAGGEQASAVT